MIPKTPFGKGGPARRGFILLSLLAMAPLACAEENLPFVVSTEDLQSRLDDPSWIVLHVADGTREYAAGHIPGALYLEWRRFVDTGQEVSNELPPLDRLQQAVHDLGIESASRIILYDGSVGIRAARIFVTLDVLGLGEHTAVLDGQLAKWKSEQRPLEQGPSPAIQPSNIELHPNLKRITGIEEIRACLGEDGLPKPDVGYKLLDARSQSQYSGSESDGGHIPGARNIPWEAFIVGGEIPVLRPKSELVEVKEAAGIDSQEPVVTYCNSGQSASLLYFVLRNLGNEVRLYDGSFSEWSEQKDAPIEKGNGTISNTE